MDVTPNIYFTSYEDEKMTKTSMFVRFMIKICFIPISVKNDCIEFKIFSCKSFVFFASFVIWNIVYQIYVQILIGTDSWKQYLNEAWCSKSKKESNTSLKTLKLSTFNSISQMILNLLKRKVDLKKSAFCLSGDQA